MAEQKEERLRFQARRVSVRCGRAHIACEESGTGLVVLTPPPDGLGVGRDGGG